MEDALRAIRSSPKPPYRQGSGSSIRRQGSGSLSRQGSATNSRQGSGGLSRQSSDVNRQGSGGSVRSATSSNPVGQSLADRAQQHAREVAARTELHNGSIRNLHNSKNLFEQQLDQQQQTLKDHHQQSLHQFNEAIHQEMARDRKIQGLEDTNEQMQIPRSDSVSSVDSLEAEAERQAARQQQPPMGNPTPAAPGMYPSYTASALQPKTSVTNQYAHHPTSSASVLNRHNYNSITYSPPELHGTQAAYALNPSTSFVVHRSSSSPSVAVVQPSVVQPSVYDVTLPNGQDAQQEYSAKQHSHSMGSTYPEMRIEDVNENGYDDLHRPQEIIPGMSETYGVITTKSNGRYNGQYYQDSFVNQNVSTEPVHPVLGDQEHVNHHSKNEVVNGPAGDGRQVNTWATPISKSATVSHPTSVHSKQVTNVATTANTPASYVGSTPSVNSVNLLTSAKPYVPRATATTTATSLASTYTVRNNATTTNSSATHSTKPTPVSASIVTVPNSYHSIQSAVNNSNQKPKSVFKPRAQNRVEKTATIPEERRDDSESDIDVQEESKPEPVPAPKGILKKTSSSPVVKTEITTQPRVRGGGYARRGLYSRGVKTNASVRDSIEVTREQMSSRQEKEV